MVWFSIRQPQTVCWKLFLTNKTLAFWNGKFPKMAKLSLHSPVFSSISGAFHKKRWWWRRSSVQSPSIPFPPTVTCSERIVTERGESNPIFQVGVCCCQPYWLLFLFFSFGGEQKSSSWLPKSESICRWPLAKERCILFLLPSFVPIVFLHDHLSIFSNFRNRYNNFLIKNTIHTFQL